MGFATIKTSIKDHRMVLLLFAVVFFLSVQETYGDNKSSNILNRNYCRNHIFSPRCRGQQKRDVMSRPSEEYRLPVVEDFSGIDRSREITAILNSPTLLGELLRKIVETPEYESDTSNYLK
ncbi:hypothetical protein Zmor_009541 [Zophobas morio]|uniref:Uncharacterized protein n=2 Tax=Zophobas TaxID=7073 RepID=A0AA38MIW5_9CUCU|nr:hypothetical protein Zmor_009541 [Zophobas morio]